MWIIKEASAMSKKTIGKFHDGNHISNAARIGVGSSYDRELYGAKEPISPEQVYPRMTIEYLITTWGKAPNITYYTNEGKMYWEPSVERKIKAEVLNKYKPMGLYNVGYIDGIRHHLGCFAGKELYSATTNQGYIMWMEFTPTEKPVDELLISEKVIKNSK